MTFHHPPAKREPYSGSRNFVIGVQSLKHGEDSLVIFRLDTDSVVGDSNLHLVLFLLDLQSYLERFRFSILDRVAYQILE